MFQLIVLMEMSYQFSKRLIDFPGAFWAHVECMQLVTSASSSCSRFSFRVLNESIDHKRLLSRLERIELNHLEKKINNNKQKNEHYEMLPTHI